MSRSPRVECITPRQSPPCVPLVCENFAENPEFRGGNFAVNLKREISRAKVKCHETPSPAPVAPQNGGKSLYFLRLFLVEPIVAKGKTLKITFFFGVLPTGGATRIRVRVRARVRARVAIKVCSPPAALLQVNFFSCCFNTNMKSLQNFEYFEYKHI